MNEFLKNKQEDLGAFHAEIAMLKKLEERENVAHLQKCNPAELGEEDKKIYEKLKSGSLTKEELWKHRDEVLESGNESRDALASYAANKIMIKNILKK